MFFDDYDGYIEPSEADEIINDALDRIKEIVVDEAKTALAEVAAAEEKLHKLDLEICGKEAKLAFLENDIEKAKAEVERVTRDIPKKYISAFVREATGFLAPGDEVWMLAGGFEPCDRCKGKKELTGRYDDGTPFKERCPKCRGNGSVYKSRMTVKKEKVREVYLKLCFDANRVNYWNTDSIFLGGDEYSTPIKDIFKTEEEAIAALEEG